MRKYNINYILRFRVLDQVYPLEIYTNHWIRLYPFSVVHANDEGQNMYPMPGDCPVCGETLEVTRLHCRHCDTILEGHFTLGRLARLSAEQLHFVETFIRCEGTIKRVEKELGISYPTVRSRLKEVIRAMGFEVISDYTDNEHLLSDDERSTILDQLANGELSSEEALSLLRRS